MNAAVEKSCNAICTAQREMARREAGRRQGRRLCYYIKIHCTAHYGEQAGAATGLGGEGGTMTDRGAFLQQIKAKVGTTNDKFVLVFRLFPFPLLNIYKLFSFSLSSPPFSLPLLIPLPCCLVTFIVGVIWAADVVRLVLASIHSACGCLLLHLARATARHLGHSLKLR